MKGSDGGRRQHGPFDLIDFQEVQEPFETSPAQNIHETEEVSKVIAVSKQFSGDLQALDEKVKSMMERRQKMIPDGKLTNGTPRQRTAFICKVCGKEGRTKDIRDHIEANHLEGISIPCDYCEKTFSSRVTLRNHKSKFHNK